VIEAVSIIHPLHVEVIALGARGGKQEWIIDYDRHNKLTGAYCYKGPSCTETKSAYYPPQFVPGELVEAAWRVFSEVHKE
jgi:hypothetical protein